MHFNNPGLEFMLFMLVFLVGVAALAGLAFLIVRLVRRARESAEEVEYLKFNRELDAKLEKSGFTRTLVIGDDLAFDEGRGYFYCCFPYARLTAQTVLPISAITEYRIEPAAAFTEGYLFTYAFVEQEPPRKVSRQAHVIDGEIKDRLLAVLEKYGAKRSGL